MYGENEPHDPGKEEKPALSYPIMVRGLVGNVVTFHEDFKFHVDGPYFEKGNAREKIFSALEDALAEIQKRHADAQKEAALKIDLRLRVTTEDGASHVVTRINRTTAELNNIPSGNRFVYPTAPGIVEKLERRKRLANELNAIMEELDKVKIKVSRNWGRIDIESLPGYVKELDAEYKAAYERAVQKPELVEVKKA